MKWLTTRVKRLGRWVIGLPKTISIPAAVVLVGGLSFGIYWAVDFYSYMQDDPQFCQSCHIMQESWDRWATSEHAQVGCHKCHHQSVFASASLMFNFIFKSYERVEKHAMVQDEYCIACHESGDPRWLQIAETSGHKQHTEHLNIACTKCHSTTVHRFHPPGVICQVCHTEQKVEISGMAGMHCPTCHDFLSNDELPLPTRAACLDCHEALEAGVTWSPDDPMQFPCGDCHLPHQPSSPTVECQSCHSVGGYHLKGAHRASPCQACHHPHQWRITERATCLTCHPGKSEHNPGVMCDTCHQFPGT